MKAETVTAKSRSQLAVGPNTENADHLRDIYRLHANAAEALAAWL